MYSYCTFAFAGKRDCQQGEDGFFRHERVGGQGEGGSEGHRDPQQQSRGGRQQRQQHRQDVEVHRQGQERAAVRVRADQVRAESVGDEARAAEALIHGQDVCRHPEAEQRGRKTGAGAATTAAR